MTRRSLIVAAACEVAQVAVAVTALAIGASSPIWLIAVIALGAAALMATLSPLYT